MTSPAGSHVAADAPESGRVTQAVTGRTPCAIIGSGNIGTDLLYKLTRSRSLQLRAMVGIDPDSDGLARAHGLGYEVSAEGVSWLLSRAGEFRLVFDATSARTHRQHASLLNQAGLIAVDLTPAAVGPAVVPSVNLTEHLNELNVNLTTCGGQATIPIVRAVTKITEVVYAEIVSTVSSRSAGPGTRQNIDDFTRTTARGLVTIGGARTGKAIIILNPADPPILMRNTVYCSLSQEVDRNAVLASIQSMIGQVAAYVPGYRIKGTPVFDTGPFVTPGGLAAARLTVLLEVEGAADYLPAFAGNLDIMTSAAVRVGEMLGATELTQSIRL